MRVTDFGQLIPRYDEIYGPPPMSLCEVPIFRNLACTDEEQRVAEHLTKHPDTIINLCANHLKDVNMFIDDEIVEILELEEMDLIDIEVDGDHLFVANGILTHNSSLEAMGEFDQSHTAGGISKINTADNAIALYAPPSHKERGEFDFVFLKTRGSAGVGQRIKLAYDNTCMRISDPVLSARDVEQPSSYRDLQQQVKNKLDRKTPTNDRPDKNVGLKLVDLMNRSRSTDD
jgi:hypothetical protein